MEGVVHERSAEVTQQLSSMAKVAATLLRGGLRGRDDQSQSPDESRDAWDDDPRNKRFDPFQIFEVIQKKCRILHVHVIDGTNITKGWLNDLIDEPDPYLVLSVPGTPNGKKRTKTIDNCKKPVWNEDFQFFMDPSDIYQLELVLMDANYTLDEEMGRQVVNLDLDLNTEVRREATFENGSKVYFNMKITEDENPDLRYSLTLSEDEKNFLKVRRARVLEAMGRLLGEERSPREQREVPVVGLLGSGGGFRAMTAMSGVCHALHDEGVIDCLMYMAGLSGSTWYLSFLYSHPDFPELRSPGDLTPELRDAVGRNWVKLLTPAGVIRYSRAILAKMKGGQPVSFTDLFGHLVGDTLLGRRKDTTLTDQRRCLQGGAAPLPLYTCLNVKKNVSAKVFQDWIEFSPYEVGVAKYGAFMKPEHFSSKFYVGKLLRKFPECPMHFLQGTWGSAFCILFKRLLRESSNDKNKDLAELIRDRNDEAGDEMASMQQVSDFVIADDEGHCESGSSGDEMEDHSSDESTASSVQGSPDRKLTSASSGAARNQKDNGTTENKNDGRFRGRLQRAGAIYKRSEESGEDEGGVSPREPRGRVAWQERRRTTRKLRQEKMQGFWQGALDSLFSSSVLDTRAGRAGLVFNPLRGLNLKNTFAVSPFSPTTAEDETDFKGFFEASDVRAKKLYLVDSGLTFNLPFPLLLRPQRAVDLYLSFDFSGRSQDESSPFKEVLLAEQWARLNEVPFPPVSDLVEKFEHEPIREWYLFEDPTDPYCPVILHFIILNKAFREFKAPGVPRTTPEEKEFANFDIFSDPDTPYSIYNFCYTAEQFDRMSQLMEFNVRLGMDEIKSQIARAVQRKRNLLPKPPVPLSEVPKLRDRVKDKSMLARLRSLVWSMSSASWTEEQLQEENDEDQFYDAQ